MTDSLKTCVSFQHVFAWIFNGLCLARLRLTGTKARASGWMRSARYALPFVSEKVRFPQGEFEHKTPQKKCPQIYMTSLYEQGWSYLIFVAWATLIRTAAAYAINLAAPLPKFAEVPGPVLFTCLTSNRIYSNTSNRNFLGVISLGSFWCQAAPEVFKSFGKTPQCTEAKEASKGTRERGKSPGKQWKKTAQKIILFKTQLVGKFVNKNSSDRFKKFCSQQSFSYWNERCFFQGWGKAKVAMDNAAGSLEITFAGEMSAKEARMNHIYTHRHIYVQTK